MSQSCIQARIVQENEPVRVKNRDDPENASVSFSVGMVMKHKRYSYTCVIHGWDPVCKQSQVRGTTLHTKKDIPCFYRRIRLY